MNTRRPYLIIPKLIQQPTWGGDYILTLKGWTEKGFLKGQKIGQSYELYGQSKLAIGITDSASAAFMPEVGFADKPDIIKEYFTYSPGDYLVLADLVKADPESVLGPKLMLKTHTMDLLIKINQAFGNSFQLHIKPGVKSDRWEPKPESWYYLEDGQITFGLNPATKVDEYKRACHAINDMMKTLSRSVKSGEKTLEEAKHEAAAFIHGVNPWQYINVHKIKKYSLIDLSMGGLHHSWEENKEEFPQGNVVYEVQRDAMDPVSTIRSFDQGKFKDSGDIREIHIDDYFTYLDTDPEHNDLARMRQERKGDRMLTSDYYCMDIIELDGTRSLETGSSFCHLFVRDGAAAIKTENGSVRLGQGHSCFLPHAVGSFQIEGAGTLLKTYIEV